MTKPTEQLIDEGWEKRFDADFYQNQDDKRFFKIGLSPERVKDFIRKEIAEAYSRGLGDRDDAIAEGMKLGYERGLKDGVKTAQFADKTIEELMKKYEAEAIEMTREDDLATITKLRNQYADKLSYVAVYKTAVLDELLSSLPNKHLPK